MKVEGSSIHSVLPIASSILNLGKTSYSSHNEVNTINGGPTTTRIAGIKKYVTIHTPPSRFDEPQQPKVIRVGGEPEKHVNIVFVKLQSPTSSKKTEVILPEPPQHKNIVYILLQKQEPLDNIRIVRPPAKRENPEIYFIRYRSPNSNELPASNVIENAKQPASIIGATFTEAPIYSSFSTAYGLPMKNYRN
ncbi:hypothetical protein Ocin01_03383 [Orchesella cincta]|uniref:DUF243 domain-containing protein n=1 Tax=Orchesella cincta TaxID=48709 RepID=A0A1D2NDV0_ORCCI|nr:hypothetical protein Ocin01_03383 [Orchesella cincta]